MKLRERIFRMPIKEGRIHDYDFYSKTLTPAERHVLKGHGSGASDENLRSEAMNPNPLTGVNTSKVAFANDVEALKAIDKAYKLFGGKPGKHKMPIGDIEIGSAFDTVGNPVEKSAIREIMVINKPDGSFRTLYPIVEIEHSAR